MRRKKNFQKRKWKYGTEAVENTSQILYHPRKTQFSVLDHFPSLKGPPPQSLLANAPVDSLTHGLHMPFMVFLWSVSFMLETGLCWDMMGLQGSQVHRIGGDKSFRHRDNIANKSINKVSTQTLTYDHSQDFGILFGGREWVVWSS